MWFPCPTLSHNNMRQQNVYIVSSSAYAVSKASLGFSPELLTLKACQKMELEKWFQQIFCYAIAVFMHKAVQHSIKYFIYATLSRTANSTLNTLCTLKTTIPLLSITAELVNINSWMKIIIRFPQFSVLVLLLFIATVHTQVNKIVYKMILIFIRKYRLYFPSHII